MCGKAALLKTHKDVGALAEKDETKVTIAMARPLKNCSWLLADQQQIRANGWTQGATKRYADACSAGKAVTSGPTDSASNDFMAIVPAGASALMSQATSQRTQQVSKFEMEAKGES